MKEFNRFYDTKTDVYSEGGRGYEGNNENTLLGSVMCDVQPYDDDTDSNIYGLQTNKAYKIFCEENDLIKEGNRVLLMDKFFRIVRSEKRKLGICAVVREI